MHIPTLGICSESVARNQRHATDLEDSIDTDMADIGKCYLNHGEHTETAAWVSKPFSVGF